MSPVDEILDIFDDKHVAIIGLFIDRDASANVPVLEQ